MKDKEQDLMELITDTVNLAMKAQEKYMKLGPYKILSLTEIHVIEAVSKETFPTMSNVANRLKVTVGTLTTNVGTIIKKGYLLKEQYKPDKRFYLLKITDQGYEALAYHDKYHDQLSSLYSDLIPEEQYNWVYETFQKVQAGIKEKL